MADRAELERRFEQEPDQATALELAALAARHGDGAAQRRWAVEAAAIGPMDEPVRAAMRAAKPGFLIRQRVIYPEPVDGVVLTDGETLAIESIAVHENGSRVVSRVGGVSIVHRLGSTIDGGLIILENNWGRPSESIRCWYAGDEETVRLPARCHPHDAVRGSKGHWFACGTRGGDALPWIACFHGGEWSEFPLDVSGASDGRSYERLALLDGNLFAVRDDDEQRIREPGHGARLEKWSVDRTPPELVLGVELPTHSNGEEIEQLDASSDWLLLRSYGLNHEGASQTLALIDRETLRERVVVESMGGRSSTLRFHRFHVHGSHAALALGRDGVAILDLDASGPLADAAERESTQPARSPAEAPLYLDLDNPAPRSGLRRVALPLNEDESVRDVTLFGEPERPTLAALVEQGDDARVEILSWPFPDRHEP